jgi:chemotaxis protein MotB
MPVRTLPHGRRRLAAPCSFVAVAVIGASLGLTSCVSQAAHQRVLNQYDHLLRKEAAQDAYVRRLEADLKDMDKTVQDAEWVRDQRQRWMKLLGASEDGQMLPDTPGVTVIHTKEGVGFNIAGEVLFAPGQDKVSDAGRATIKKLVDSVLRDDQRIVRIDGHTDSDPISRSSWETNLQLSAARAYAVAKILLDNGVPQNRVRIAGFGTSLPRAQGIDDAAKRANRRVEVLLLN